MVPGFLLGGIQFQVMTTDLQVLNSTVHLAPHASQILLFLSMLCFHLSAVLPVKQLKALCLIWVSSEEWEAYQKKKKNTALKLAKKKEQK